MGRIGAITVDGASGLPYSFNVYAFNASLKAVGGVYVVTRLANDEHTILYIGQTEDLSVIFEDHDKIDCFRKHKANCICVHRDDSKASRLDKEVDLIEAWNPPCNG